MAERYETERVLAEQQQRYELVLSTVKGADGSGFEQLSNTVLADLLATVALMPVEEKIEAFGRSGWVKNLVAAVQKQAQINMAQAASEAEDVAGDSKLSEAERRRRIREIFKREDVKK